MYFEAEISTVIILILSIGLSMIISLNLMRKRTVSLFYWNFVVLKGKTMSLYETGKDKLFAKMECFFSMGNYMHVPLI